MIRSRYIFLFLSLAVVACNRAENVVPEPEPFVVTAPDNLGRTVPAPERNPFTREGVLLGRKLFYDPILSGNNKISCASCHQPEKAFTEGLALSKGISGNALKRHTPSIQNIAWQKGWFWDGGAKDIESLNFGPIKSPDEMGQNLGQLVTELQNHPEYPGLFRTAFGTDTISTTLITRALAQFERTLISANSRYDKFVRKEAGGNLSAIELEGLSLFQQKCSSCHSSDFFTDQGYHNNGLDNTFPDAFEAIAWGRGRISEKPEDIGKFKTPTLRNIALTAPYMHDGRFQSLEQVLEHYRSGVKTSATLDAALQQNGTVGIAMTEAEKNKIIQFLNTLTDPEFTQNASLKNPN